VAFALLILERKGNAPTVEYSIKKKQMKEIYGIDIEGV